MRTLISAILCTIALGCQTTPNVASAIPAATPTISPSQNAPAIPNDFQIRFDLPENRALVWTQSDITLEEKGKLISLFRRLMYKLHEQQIGRLSSSKAIHGAKFTESAAVTIISIVGTIVTFEVNAMRILDGGTAENESWWLTIDLRKDGEIVPFDVEESENVNSARMVAITELFSEKEVVNALISNPQIQRALTKQVRTTMPETLKDLFENEGKNIDEPRIETDDGNYFLSPYSMDHFSFDRVQDGKIYIDFALVSFALARSYEVHSIEIPFTITPSLSTAIEAASQNKSGFLSHTRDATIDGNWTQITLESQIR